MACHVALLSNLSAGACSRCEAKKGCAMPEVQSFAETVAPNLAFALILVAAACMVRAAVNGYRAGWLWLNRKIPVADPIVARALQGIKPPPYWLFALGWFFFGALAFFCAMKLKV